MEHKSIQTKGIVYISDSENHAAFINAGQCKEQEEANNSSCSFDVRLFLENGYNDLKV